MVHLVVHLCMHVVTHAHAAATAQQKPAHLVHLPLVRWNQAQLGSIPMVCGGNELDDWKFYSAVERHDGRITVERIFDANDPNFRE